jgi:hypothetical protein
VVLGLGLGGLGFRSRLSTPISTRAIPAGEEHLGEPHNLFLYLLFLFLFLFGRGCMFQFTHPEGANSGCWHIYIEAVAHVRTYTENLIVCALFGTGKHNAMYGSQ